MGSEDTVGFGFILKLSHICRLMGRITTLRTQGLWKLLEEERNGAGNRMKLLKSICGDQTPRLISEKPPVFHTRTHCYIKSYTEVVIIRYQLHTIFEQ